MCISGARAAFARIAAKSALNPKTKPSLNNFNKRKRIMIVIMQIGATAKQISSVIERIKEMGLDAHLSEGQERTIIGVVGDKIEDSTRDSVSLMDGVEN